LITCVLRDIFRVNLGVRRHEKVLIFNDRISKKEDVGESDEERRTKLRCLALLAAETGKGLCKSITRFEYPATGSHGAEPPASLWKLAFGEKAVEILEKEHLLRPILKKKATDSAVQRAEDIIRKYKHQAVDCVIALSNYSTSHTRFRDFLTRVCGCRFASMPLFDISMLEGSMNVDWKTLARITTDLAGIVNTAERVDIKTPNGTAISFSKKARKALADTGILTRKGSFSNLPAGEVYLAPVEGTARGRLVLEWGPTRHLESPVILTIKDGYVSDVAGKDEYAGYIRMKLAERIENGNIAELGIGTNSAAKRPDNILESEKILGTIHIALGDNSSFGGNVKTPFHQDFVFFKPTVTLIGKDGDRKDILKGGKLLCSRNTFRS
jgi:leucyl aminopeptidase (aminopeptidase T)